MKGEIILRCWLLAAPLIMFAWVFRPATSFWKYDWNQYAHWLPRVVAKIIGGSAFAGLFFIVWQGTDSILNFLPESWGGFNAEGNRNSTKSIISVIFGLISALAVLNLLITHNEKRRNQFSNNGKEI